MKLVGELKDKVEKAEKLTHSNYQFVFRMLRCRQSA